MRDLKGFGAKTEEAILAGIEPGANRQANACCGPGRRSTPSALREHLRSCQSVEQIEVAGSYRRGRETIGDLDLLVVSSNVDEVMDRFAEFPDAETVIGRGATKMSIRLADGLQVDLRVVPAKSFGAALVYFTGSKDHNIVLRGLAKDRGLKINEYGVFRVAATRRPTSPAAPKRRSTPRSTCPGFRPSCARPGANSSGPPAARFPSSSSSTIWSATCTCTPPPPTARPPWPKWSTPPGHADSNTSPLPITPSA